jgi:hypothetical protein
MGNFGVEYQPDVIRSNERHHQSGKLQETLIGRQGVIDRLNDLRHERGQITANHLYEKVLLGREMLVEGRTTDTHLGCEICMGHVRVADLPNELARRVEELIANIVAIGLHGHEQKG